MSEPKSAPAVSLFKIITIRDEVVIGLRAEELVSMGATGPGAVGRALKANGELTAWQYSVRKGSDGELEQAPLRRISILAHESLRVEPVTPSIRVIAIP